MSYPIIVIRHYCHTPLLYFSMRCIINASAFCSRGRRCYLEKKRCYRIGRRCFYIGRRWFQNVLAFKNATHREVENNGVWQLDPLISLSNLLCWCSFSLFVHRSNGFWIAYFQLLISCCWLQLIKIAHIYYLLFTNKMIDIIWNWYWKHKS